MSYIRFTARSRHVGRKTDVFDVVNVQTDANLGVVAFYPRWRKFVCEAQPGIIFDSSCYREIADFMDAQTRAWKASL